MAEWLIPGVFGGLVGGTAAVFVVSKLNHMVKSNACPQCGGKLDGRAAGPRTWRQFWWGGWTCPDCGCDVDNFGRKVE